MNIKLMLSGISFIIFPEYKTNAQNLVANYSFEAYTICPDNEGQINKAIPWASPSTNTPDYYNNCNSGNFSVPKNIMGYQNALSGVAYAGIYTYLQIDEREYVHVKLLDSLKKGKKYCVRFYVSLANISKYATDAIGAYLSKDSIRSNNSKNLPYFPQIKNPSNKILKDTAIWVLVGDTFIANGGEQYLTIGNFYSDINTTIVDVGGLTDSYYYIDDVTVTLCDSGVGIKDPSTDAGKSLGLKLYPNPANGLSLILYRLPAKSHVLISVYDIIGNKVADVREEKQPAGEQELAFDVSGIPAGVYFLKALVNGLVAQIEKIIIIK